VQIILNNNIGKMIHDHEIATAFSFYHEIQAIFEAIYRGAAYGMKIRFPHALVMTFLFRRDISLRRKIMAIMKLTMSHMWSLAKFAGVYKVRKQTLSQTTSMLTLVLRKVTIVLDHSSDAEIYKYQDAPARILSSRDERSILGLL